MIKIGIELNNILRDINSQVIKYYKKDINKTFDDKGINMNVLNVADNLKFDDKKGKYNFMYIDYPYEIFGCAKPMHKNLSVMLNNFLVHLTDIDRDDIKVSLFSLRENALTIQSTYFFLSKIGSRVREMIFPINGASLWKNFDVLITSDENIIKNKPSNKTVILIAKDDNKHLTDECDLVYDSLFDLLSDDEFLKKLDFAMKNKSESFYNKIKNKLKKLF